MTDQGPNVQAFINAGMLTQTAAEQLSTAQRNTIEEWSSEVVETLISCFEQTGQITGGILWI